MTSRLRDEDCYEEGETAPGIHDIWSFAYQVNANQ
jgi:hypothetical protein